MSAEHVIVTSTTSSEQAARELASRAVEANLGACAQIVGPVTSVFRWEGRIQTEQEWRVEIKTAADRVTQLTGQLRAHHEYDIPEIVVTPLVGGSAAYLDWLVAETRGS